MRYDLKECGKRIQQLRKEQGMSQEQLAEKLNVSQNTIAKIECGLRRPSVDFLLELSEFFDVSMNCLVLGVPAKDVENEALKKDIDKGIEEIDSIVEQFLEKKKELLKMKSELN